MALNMAISKESIKEIKGYLSAPSSYLNIDSSLRYGFADHIGKLMLTNLMVE